MANVTYAVVDMSKKKKNLKSPHRDTAMESCYSVITKECMDNASSSLPDNIDELNTSSTSTADWKDVMKIFKHKATKFVFIIATFAVVVIVFALVVVLFAKIATLESENVSFRQQLTQSQQQNSNSSSDLQIQLLELSNTIHMLNDTLAGQHSPHPAVSCAALPPSSLSGYYWARTFNGSAVRVYCDMTRSCGNNTGGWVRVAEVDMRDSSQQCPNGLAEVEDSNMRACRRNEPPSGCSRVEFLTNKLHYSKVCGRIMALQIGSVDAFQKEGNPNISSNYLDGVSLTHANPKQHIWTFAASNREEKCPCSSQGMLTPPSFVGSDYFCDTGTLWDGDCSNDDQNQCCSFNNPPWFYKQLPQPTTDDIEMRVCRDESRSNEDIWLQIMQLFIQ